MGERRSWPFWDRLSCKCQYTELWRRSRDLWLPPLTRRPRRKMTARSYSWTTLTHMYSENGTVAATRRWRKQFIIVELYRACFPHLEVRRDRLWGQHRWCDHSRLLLLQYPLCLTHFKTPTYRARQTPLSPWLSSNTQTDSASSQPSSSQLFSSEQNYWQVRPQQTVFLRLTNPTNRPIVLIYNVVNDIMTQFGPLMPVILISTLFRVQLSWSH